MAKITDPSKLLPSAKSTAITKIGKANFTSPLKISKKSTSITKGLLGESNQKDSVDVNNKLVKVEKFFQSDLLVSKKKAETKRKEKEKEEFKKEEEKLEAPKEAKKFNLPSLSVPGMSFLDRIKRFLFFTALGWLFTKFQDQLPKLLGVVKLVTGVYGVAENIFKTLLTGLVDFIDIGYQTYDGLRKKVEDLGGKDAAKTFDDFSSHLNKLINGTLMVATLVASTASKQSSAPSGAGAAAGVPKPTTPKPISGFGGGTEMTPDRYRAPGQSASRGFALEQARKGLTFEQSVAARQAAKVAPVAKGARFGAGRIPIVGPLITFGIRTLVYGEKPQKAAAAAVGMGIGQAIGTFIGTLGAGALGLGTAGLGAVVAPLIIGAGSVIGGLVGEWIGAKLYDFVAGFGKNKKPQLKAAGGSVTRGGKPQGAGPSRTLKISKRRPPKVKPKQSQPGKDVGGKKKIRELYPDPSVRTDIEGEQKGAWFNLLPPLPENASAKQKAEREAKIKSLPNPYKALTNTAKVLKDIPFGIGALMGGAVDIALGQKLPKDAIRGLSGGISYLITSIANRQISASISNIEKEVSKMQTGGVVRARDFTKSSEVGPGEGITKALDNLIYQKVDEAIREVQKQLMPGKYNEKTTGRPGGGGPGGPGGGGPDGGGGMLPGDAPPEVKAALEAIAGAEGGWDSVNPGKVVPGLRNMTIAQAREVGMRQRAIEGTGALGKFQQIPVYNGVNVLKQRAEAAGLNYERDKFNEENQTRITRAYLADIYPGGEAQLVKDAKKDPMILANKLKGVYPSLPGGNQPNVNTPGYLDRYNKSLEKYRTVRLGAITADKIYPLDPSQGRDPKEPGIDFTYRNGQTLALYPGKVVDIGSQYNSSGGGYGNYVLVESVDPNNGKKFTALYAHFGDGKISVRKGDTIQSGQPIGAQPNKDKKGFFTGSGSGEHTSVDFYEPDGRTRYSNANKLIDQILDTFAGKNPYPTQSQPAPAPAPTPAPAGAPGTQPGQQPAQKPGVINASNIALVNLNDRVSKLKPGEKIVFDRVGSIQVGTGWLGRPQIKYYNSTGSSISKEDFDKLLAPSEVLKKMKYNDTQVRNLQGGGVIPKQSPNRNVSSLKSYPSYADGGIMIAIQPMIIEKPIPVPMAKNKTLMFPISIEVNNSMPSLSRG